MPVGGIKKIKKGKEGDDDDVEEDNDEDEHAQELLNDDQQTDFFARCRGQTLSRLRLKQHLGAIVGYYACDIVRVFAFHC